MHIMYVNKNITKNTIKNIYHIKFSKFEDGFKRLFFKCLKKNYKFYFFPNLTVTLQIFQIVIFTQKNLFFSENN